MAYAAQNIALVKALRKRAARHRGTRAAPLSARVSRKSLCRSGIAHHSHNSIRVLGENGVCGGHTAHSITQHKLLSSRRKRFTLAA